MVSILHYVSRHISQQQTTISVFSMYQCHRKIFIHLTWTLNPACLIDYKMLKSKEARHWLIKLIQIFSSTWLNTKINFTDHCLNGFNNHMVESRNIYNVEYLSCILYVNRIKCYWTKYYSVFFALSAMITYMCHPNWAFIFFIEDIDYRIYFIKAFWMYTLLNLNNSFKF
jgi:hypothetical protein